MVQPEYGKISRVENLKSQVKVKADCPFDLGDEVKKTISLTAQAFLHLGFLLYRMLQQ